MRRSLAAFAVAALCVLGAAGAGSVTTHDLPSSGALAFSEATTAVRVAAVAVPAPQPMLVPLGVFAVLVATAFAVAVLLGYLARQRRRALLVPVLASPVRRRGPPAPPDHR
jgi:hypothetical protein